MAFLSVAGITTSELTQAVRLERHKMMRLSHMLMVMHQEILIQDQEAGVMDLLVLAQFSLLLLPEALKLVQKTSR